QRARVADRTRQASEQRGFAETTGPKGQGARRTALLAVEPGATPHPTVQVRRVDSDQHFRLARMNSAVRSIPSSMEISSRPRAWRILPLSGTRRRISPSFRAGLWTTLDFDPRRSITR